MNTSAGFTRIVSTLIALGALVIAVFFIFLLSRGLQGPREVPNPGVIPIPGTPTTTTEEVPMLPQPLIVPESTASPKTELDKEENKAVAKPLNEKGL